jgi:hypothetical protein
MIGGITSSEAWLPMIDAASCVMADVTHATQWLLGHILPLQAVKYIFFMGVLPRIQIQCSIREFPLHTPGKQPTRSWCRSGRYFGASRSPAVPPVQCYSMMARIQVHLHRAASGATIGQPAPLFLAHPLARTQGANSESKAMSSSCSSGRRGTSRWIGSMASTTHMISTLSRS